MWESIVQQINSKWQGDFQLLDIKRAGGGDICESFFLLGEPAPLFAKLHRAQKIGLLQAEEAALKAISRSDTIATPLPICSGVIKGRSFLVMTAIDTGASQNWTQKAWHTLGQNLALLHRVEQSDAFGWSTDNFIGSTRQINEWHHEWSEFFLENRLGYQLKLAKLSGASFSLEPELIQAVSKTLLHHNVRPSLVHGDLWSGNILCAKDKTPHIFDPAAYYGDREVDLAMSELFGGFAPAFYQGYQETWPLAAGFEKRKVIYNLYHILNHFNMFGGSYLGQAKSMMQQIIGNA